MSVYSNAFSAFSGWSNGYQYATDKVKEDEIKQGKNYYVSCFKQFSQILFLGGTIHKVAELTLKETKWFKTATLLCNIVPLLSLPYCLFSAVVAQGHFKEFAGYWNKSKYAIIKLPEKLGDKTSRFFNYSAEHLGDLTRVAIIVSAVVILALKEYYFGGAVVAALAYQLLDSSGRISRKISLFIETYMPTITLFGCISGGALPNQIAGILQLPTIMPRKLNKLFFRITDQFIRLIFNVKGPTIKQIESPFSKNQNLSFEEINMILDANDDEFEVNPTFCVLQSNKEFLSKKLKPSTDFEQLKKLFDKINWSEKYNVVKKKVLEDDRFIDFLIKENPDIPKKEIKANIDEYLAKVAKKLNKTNSAHLVIDWAKEQMRLLIDNFTGKKRVKGSQLNLQDAIEDVSFIIPYLNSLDPANDRVDLEDKLLELAVTAGDYCAMGIKTVCHDMLDLIYIELMSKDSNTTITPVDLYEIKMKKKLAEMRSRIIEKSYKSLIVDTLSTPDLIAHDNHSFDTVKLFMSFGFTQLTQNERDQMSVSDFALWLAYSKKREEMFGQFYQEMFESVKGEDKLEMYGIFLAGSFPNLSPEQYDAIFNLAFEPRWDRGTVDKRFTRLMFYMMGAIRKKNNKIG